MTGVMTANAFNPATVCEWRCAGVGCRADGACASPTLRLPLRWWRPPFWWRANAAFLPTNRHICVSHMPALVPVPTGNDLGMMVCRVHAFYLVGAGTTNGLMRCIINKSSCRGFLAGTGGVAGLPCTYKPACGVARSSSTALAAQPSLH